MSVLLDFIKFNELSNWSVTHLLQNHFNYNKDFELVKIGSFLKRNKTQIIVDDDTTYKRVTIKLYNGGVFLRDTETGKNIGTKKQFTIKEGQFLLSKIDARNGAFGIATNEVDEAIVTADFLAFDIDISKINPDFLVLITTTKKFMQFAQSASSGTTGRQRIDEARFLDTKIPLPKLDIQKQIVENYQNKINLANEQEGKAKDLEQNIEEYLIKELSLEFYNYETQDSILKFIQYKNKTDVWGVEKILLNNEIYLSKKYELKKISNFFELVRGVTYKKTSEVTDNGYKVLRANNINLDNSLNTTEIKQVAYYENFSDSKKLLKDDIFICLASGSKKHIGKVSFISEDTNFYFGGFMGAIRLKNNNFNPKYLYVFLTSNIFNSYLGNTIFGANINNLSSDILYNFKIPVPPIETQEKISNHIEILKNEIKTLNEQSENNKKLALEEFEKEVFSEA